MSTAEKNRDSLLTLQFRNGGEKTYTKNEPIVFFESNFVVVRSSDGSYEAFRNSDVVSIKKTPVKSVEP